MAEQENPEERLQTLQELRGAALVSALIKELGLLQRQVTHLQSEMSVYRDYLAARDRWLDTEAGQKPRTQLPRSVVIDASQSLYPRQGFYGLEYAEKGVPFSWTGPASNFSFDIFIDRRAGAQLELRALSCLDFERQKNIRLMVNGESVTPTVVQQGRGLILRATLPAADDDRGTNLLFSVPEMLRPPEPDKRILGIAFNSLNVTSGTEQRTEKPSETVVPLPRPAPIKRAVEEAPSEGAVAADKAAS